MYIHMGVDVCMDVCMNVHLHRSYDSLFCPGVWVDGIHLGGMAPMEAKEAVEAQSPVSSLDQGRACTCFHLPRGLSSCNSGAPWSPGWGLGDEK